MQGALPTLGIFSVTPEGGAKAYRDVCIEFYRSLGSISLLVFWPANDNFLCFQCSHTQEYDAHRLSKTAIFSPQNTFNEYGP